MPKNLTVDDLQAIEKKSDEVISLMLDAVEKIRKMHVDKLPDLPGYAEGVACLARDANNLGVFLLMQHRMQEQREEVERLRGEVGAK